MATTKNINIQTSKMVVGSSKLNNRINSQSSRKVAGSTIHAGGSGGGGSQSTQVYLDGVNVTPQSLLYTRAKSLEKTGRQGKSKKVIDENAKSASRTSLSQISMSDGESSAGNDSTKSIDMILSGTPSPGVTATKTASMAPKKTDILPISQEENENGDRGLVSGLDEGVDTQYSQLKPQTARYIKYNHDITYHTSIYQNVYIFPYSLLIAFLAFNHLDL
jgi:hypothetical protein